MLLVCYLAFFAALGRSSLWRSQEGRVVRIAGQMLRSGDWIVPRTDEFRPATGKPALYGWLVAGLGKLRGLDETTARTPSAVAAALVVLLVYGWGTSVMGVRGGLVSALMLATSLRFVVLARLARVDMVLTLWVTLSYLFFYLGYREVRRSQRCGLQSPPVPRRSKRSGPLDLRPPGLWFLLTYLALALGMLTKGPVGVILPVLGIGALLLFRRELRVLGEMELLRGGLLFLGLAAPWYVAVGVRTEGEFLVRFFGYQNLGRFFGLAIGSDQVRVGEPWWHYGPHFALATAPWVGLALCALLWQVSARALPPAPSPERRGARAQTTSALACSWSVTGLIFFSIAKGKRADYLLPLLPAVALLVGAFWVSVYRASARTPVRRGEGQGGWGTPTLARASAVLQGALLVGVALCVLTVGVLAPLSERWARGIETLLFHRNPYAFRAAVEACGRHLAGGLLLVIGLLATAWIWFRRRSEGGTWVAFSVTVGLVLAFLALHRASVLPALEQFDREREVASHIGRLLPPGQSLALLGVSAHSLLFYLDHPTEPPEAVTLPALARAAESPEPFFVLTSPEHYDNLPPELRDQLQCIYRSPSPARHLFLLIANSAARSHLRVDVGQ